MSQHKTKRTALNRPKLIQLIHIGKSQLHLDDDTYRSLLMSMTGKDSTKAMNIGELNKVLARLKQLGFVVTHKKKDPKPIDDKASLYIERQIKLIRHLWLELHELGAVRNGSEQALASYIKNQTQTAIEALDSEQASNIIERLKNWRKRLEKPNQTNT
ncbi:gp16 family protein [Moraxella nasicaprae]|uniref:Regulatory protein GemA n=1 Tax=Moraxella nasicaprae TaxID=2904122 RepID=A0ABY6F418_9GAMM|nr:regulatory protein GemA [Moraxella nasicaprae]UXZ04839.1 regulatory protein GemA [Moraxella nasicaprae]